VAKYLQVAEDLASFIRADYLVRNQITDSLLNNYSGNQLHPFAHDITFQVAFCYHIGFGMQSDLTECKERLQKANRKLSDLQVERDTVHERDWNNDRMTQAFSDGLPYQLNLIHG